MKGVQAKLAVKPDSNSKICKAQTTPCALCEAIEKDFSQLQQLGVIESVKYSDWSTPIVPVRICGDFKVAS